MQLRSATAIDELCELIHQTQKKVVFITGAGISVSSGIPLYRNDSALSVLLNDEEPRRDSKKLKTQDDTRHGDHEHQPHTEELRVRSPFTGGAIWNTYVESLAQRSAFLKDPVGWYAEFWNKSHDTDVFRNAVPNDAHKALAQLCRKYPSRLRIITQNLTALHLKAGTPALAIAEVHGRIGRFRCSDERCVAGTKRVLEAEDCCWQSNEERYPTQSFPYCPCCNAPAISLALLFDETYQCHSGFRWSRAVSWLRTANVLVFIGTSLSVNCTFRALEYARSNDALVFNINVRRLPMVYERFDDAACFRYVQRLKRQVQQPLSTTLSSDEETQQKDAERRHDSEVSSDKLALLPELVSTEHLTPEKRVSSRRRLSRIHPPTSKTSKRQRHPREPTSQTLSESGLETQSNGHAKPSTSELPDVVKARFFVLEHYPPKLTRHLVGSADTIVPLLLSRSPSSSSSRDEYCRRTTTAMSSTACAQNTTTQCF